MFLEIKDLKKSFGTEENRTEVLKGIDFSVEKRTDLCLCLDHPVPENLRF